MAAKELNALGLAKAPGGDSIRQWNVAFRIGNVFPHPRRHVVEKKPRGAEQIFEYFPKAREMFVAIANENIHQMTGKLMIQEFMTKIVPELERDSREKGCFDDGSPGQKILVKLIAHPPSKTVVTKWFKLCNIEYDKQCTRRGKGTSYLSQRMREAWASGKYKDRRPKGQGLKKGKQDAQVDILED